MGRPLNNKFFGNPVGTGQQIGLSSAWIPGASGTTAGAWIVQQKGVRKYIITDGTDTGLVELVDGSDPITEEGKAYIAVSVFGGGTEYAKQINAHTVKTFDGNVYRWLPDGAIATGDADLPLT